MFLFSLRRLCKCEVDGRKVQESNSVKRLSIKKIKKKRARDEEKQVKQRGLKKSTFGTLLRDSVFQEDDIHVDYIQQEAKQSIIELYIGEVEA